MQIERVTYSRLVSDSGRYGNRKVEATAVFEEGEDRLFAMHQLQAYVHGSISDAIADEEQREEAQRAEYERQQKELRKQQHEEKQRRTLAPNIHIVEIEDEEFEPCGFAVRNDNRHPRMFLLADGSGWGTSDGFEDNRFFAFLTEDDARTAFSNVMVDISADDEPVKDVFADA